jgi:hypothetical protein
MVLGVCELSDIILCEVLDISPPLESKYSDAIKREDKNEEDDSRGKQGTLMNTSGISDLYGDVSGESPRRV